VEELTAELHSWYEALDARFLRQVEKESSPFHDLKPWRPGQAGD